jgi:hypothetical protein
MDKAQKTIGSQQATSLGVQPSGSRIQNMDFSCNWNEPSKMGAVKQKMLLLPLAEVG